MARPNDFFSELYGLGKGSGVAVQIGWRIRVAKEQTKSARETIEGLDGKDAEPILKALDHALECLRQAERAAQALTQRLIQSGRLPDKRGSEPDRRSPDVA